MAHNHGSSTSSPDPIAGPARDAPHLSSKPMREPSISPKKPVTPTSGNIRLQDFYLTTPSAGVMRTTSPGKSVAQTEDLISPWRIRVTVEAEKDDGQQTNRSPSKTPSKRPRSPSKSPSKLPTGRTITTTVPLKGADKSSPPQPKKGRGRPRKSLATPVKRGGTPAPRKSGRRKANEGATDNGLKVQKTDATPPKKRGRPRKSLGTDVDIDGTPAVDGLEFWIAAGSTPVAKPKSGATSTKGKGKGKGKGRRKAMSPVKVVADSSTASNDYEASGANGDAQTENEQARNLSEEPLSSPTQRRSGRTSTVQQGNSGVEAVFTTAAPTANVSSVKLSPNPKSPVIGHESSFMNDGNQIAEIIVKNRGYEIQDPTDEHHEFDSILESEGFTMVSLSSLPSAQMQMSTLPEQRDPGEAALPMAAQQDSKKQSFTPLNTAEQEAEWPGLQGNSFMPNSGSRVLLHSSTLDFTQTPPSGSDFNSSRLYKAIPQQTPSQTYSSPMLPPPVQPAASTKSPRALNKPTEGTPKMNRVVRVGAALQGVVGPADRNDIDPPSHTKQSDRSPSARPRNANGNDIFSGFGAGSRRELRAGLRLGEELAKRQQLAEQAAAVVNNRPEEVSQAADCPMSASLQRQDESGLAVPGAQSQMEYPTLPHQQLPSPDRTDEGEEHDRMSWKADTPAKNEVESAGSCAIESSPIDLRMLARLAEFQKEREAVSREIEEANSSQVIVIGSSIIEDADDMSGDEVDEAQMDGEETIDIWQSEAQQSSRLEQSTSADTSESLFSEQVIKPRRSKLPSPWRKNSQVVYSDEVETIEPAVRQPVLKHPATPQQSESRKRAKLEASSYSMPSEFAMKPDDESSLMGNKRDYSPSEDSDEEPPAKKKKKKQKKKKKPSRELTHSQYYDKIVEDMEDTWIVDDNVPDVKSSSVPPPKQHQAVKAKKPEPAKEPVQPLTSWLSRISSYVPFFRFVAPTAPPTPPAPTPPSPTYAPRSPPPSNTFSIYLPWTACHYRALQRIYLTAQNDKNRYPYRTDSEAAYLLGEEIESIGWKKPVEEWEIGVIDAFLDLMDRLGVDDGEGEWEEERELIEEDEVARRVFSLWVGQVQRGEVGVGRGTVGMFDERLRWRKKAVLEAAREAAQQGG
ncbi:hypothetical protein MMC30_002001 [Trapelia coarctata]|nr:hypothetical protein [Trapelia coarctata]